MNCSSYYTIAGFHVTKESPILERLDTLAEEKVSLACIPAEDGVIIGVLIEDILGDIGLTSPVFRQRKNQTLQVSKEDAIKEISNLFGIDLPEDHCETFGHFLVLVP